jgi:hypothetical protein
MYGKFDRTHQNSKGWTKSAMRHDEERQIAKDVEAESEFTQDCPHGLSTTDQIAGRNACYECYVLSGGEPDPGDEGIFHG